MSEELLLPYSFYRWSREVEPWMDEALCAQTDPEAFFPEKGGSVSGAKRVCASCPVRDECLAYALRNNVRHGIWGGLTPRERHASMREAA